MKNRFSLAAATALTALGVLSVTPVNTSASSARAASVTLNVVGATNELTNATRIYEKLYPNVKVNIINANWGIGGKDTRDKELILMSSGQSLDVIKMVWGKAFFRQGVLTDLTNQVKTWPIYKNYTSGQKQRITYNGKIYGITTSNNTIFLYYNKAILAKIHAQPPKTLRDVSNIARAIKAAHLKTAKGLPIFATSFEGGNWATDYWVWANGGELMTPNYKTTLIDSSKDIAAYTYMQDFIKNGEAPKVDGTYDAAWLNGQIALMPIGVWEYNASVTAKLNFGMTTMPVGPGGNDVSIGGVEYGIPVQSAHKTEALNFLKVLISRATDFQQDQTGQGEPANPALYNDPQFRAAWKKVGLLNAMMVQQQQLKHARYNFLEAPFIFPDGATAYNNALSAVLTNLANPAATMKTAAQTIDQGIATASQG